MIQFDCFEERPFILRGFFQTVHTRNRKSGLVERRLKFPSVQKIKTNVFAFLKICSCGNGGAGHVGIAEEPRGQEHDFRRVQQGFLRAEILIKHMTFDSFYPGQIVRIVFGDDPTPRKNA